MVIMRIGTMLILFVVLAVALITDVQGKEVCEIYDDFSSNTLDTKKWNESAFQGHPFTDEHFVNTTEGMYHVLQNVSRDAETNLIPLHQFVARESLKYTIIYLNGSGNHLTQVQINGTYPPIVVPTTTPLPGSGTLGYWNGVPDVGNITGIYKVKQEFFENHINQTITRPDGTSIKHTYLSVNEPYKFALNTHTGHNGLMHFDFDDFELCKDVPDVNIKTPKKGKPFSFLITDINVSFTANHSNNNLTCNISINGNTKVSGNLNSTYINEGNNTYMFILSNLTVGKYAWYVHCQDSYGHVGYSENSTFTILPNIATENGTEFKNLTETEDLTNITGYYVKNIHAVINWTDNLDLSEAINWFDYINISLNRVEINSSVITALNKKARIVLNNLSWNNPRILKDGSPCGINEGCASISYNAISGELIFDVNGFSVYQTDETPVSSPVVQSSGGGGGGGGGSRTTVPLNKTNNQPLSNNISLTKNNSLDEVSEELDNSQEGNAPITGATIGNTVKRSLIPIIALLVAMVIGVTLIKLRGNNGKAR